MVERDKNGNIWGGGPHLSQYQSFFKAVETNVNLFLFPVTAVHLR